MLGDATLENDGMVSRRHCHLQLATGEMARLFWKRALDHGEGLKVGGSTLCNPLLV